MGRICVDTEPIETVRRGLKQQGVKRAIHNGVYMYSEEQCTPGYSSKTFLPPKRTSIDLMASAAVFCYVMVTHTDVQMEYPTLLCFHVLPLLVIRFEMNLSKHCCMNVFTPIFWRMTYWLISKSWKAAKMGWVVEGSWLKDEPLRQQRTPTTKSAKQEHQ